MSWWNAIIQRMKPAPKRGLVIAAPERYSAILIENLRTLRSRLGCRLPVEVWQAGSELSADSLKSLEQIGGVRFRNVSEFTDDVEHWRGWQIKPFIVKHCAFQELILVDADVCFLQSPQRLFDDPGYRATGSFFFRDWVHHKPKDEEQYRRRVEFVRQLSPSRPEYWPGEMDWIYADEMPDFSETLWDLQESGVVCFDKRRHASSIDLLYRINDDHATTYQAFAGDKDTFWLSCAIAGKAFCFNDEPGYNHPDIDRSRPIARENVLLTHRYRGEPFFSQKGYPIISEEA